MPAYYNEHDAKAAAWLRELITRGLIAPGDVDERSITDVQPDDLRAYTQCHFFAGIGVWSYALRGAGWADADPVWTGSCPCQSFSASGKRAGFDDSRHLWPAWFRLIRECRPHVCFGEQVASADGLAWLDVVSADLEAAGYAVGAADTCAAGVGAPHIRQRLYFVADSYSDRVKQFARELSGHEGQYEVRRADGYHASVAGGAVGDMADPDIAGWRGWRPGETRPEPGALERPERLRASRVEHMANAERRGCEESDLPVRPARQDEAATVERGAGYWGVADWIPCADGKARPVEPGTFPLAHGAPARVVRLRGYGNALCAPQAQAFVEAYLSLAD